MDEEISKMLIESAVKICCCDCHFSPTVADPVDVYTLFLQGNKYCEIIDLNSIEDVESFIMKMYIKESWPPYLKKKYE